MYPDLSIKHLTIHPWPYATQHTGSQSSVHLHLRRHLLVPVRSSQTRKKCPISCIHLLVPFQIFRLRRERLASICFHTHSHRVLGGNSYCYPTVPTCLISHALWPVPASGLMNFQFESKPTFARVCKKWGQGEKQCSPSLRPRLAPSPSPVFLFSLAYRFWSRPIQTLFRQITWLG